MLFKSILSCKEKIRFHTPGHGKLDASILDCDVTELSYSDNLLSPSGEIKSLEKNLASAYNAEAAFLSTQGATLNIMQAICARADEGDILIVGQTHVSVYNACRLFNVNAYHVDKFDESSIPLSVKTVIVTSPDYFGNTLDIKEIYSVLKEKNIALIVDSAHGAHFGFSSKLPVSASEYSDFAILSLHKTMPVITGGSVLVCKEKFAEKCSYARALLHTTSPNYMTMCSIEKAIDDFKANGEKYYGEIKKSVDNFRKSLNAPYRTEYSDDFSRLVISSPYDGASVEKALFYRGFAAETSVDKRVVFIVTPYNHYHLHLLARCINELPELPEYSDKRAYYTVHETPRKLFFGKSWELVPVEKSEGRQIFNEVGIYPPGVPLLYSGDTITADAIDLLKEHAERSFGLENGRVRVIK